VAHRSYNFLNQFFYNFERSDLYVNALRKWSLDLLRHASPIVVERVALLVQELMSKKKAIIDVQFFRLYKAH
jgi:hypothetical protein